MKSRLFVVLLVAISGAAYSMESNRDTLPYKAGAGKPGVMATIKDFLRHDSSSDINALKNTAKHYVSLLEESDDRVLCLAPVSCTKSPEQFAQAVGKVVKGERFGGGSKRGTIKKIELHTDASKAAHLEALDGQLSDDAQLWRSCEELVFKGCSLREVNKYLGKCPQVRKISVDFASETNFPREAVQVFAAHLCQLRSLHIETMPYLFAEVFQGVVIEKKIEFSALGELSVGQALHDGAILFLVSRAPALKTLHADGCSSVSAFFELLKKEYPQQHLPLIEKIHDLYDQRLVDLILHNDLANDFRASVYPLVKHYTAITIHGSLQAWAQNLTFEQCSRLTIEGVDDLSGEIFTSFPNATLLRLVNCGDTGRVTKLFAAQRGLLRNYRTLEIDNSTVTTSMFEQLSHVELVRVVRCGDDVIRQWETGAFSACKKAVIDSSVPSVKLLEKLPNIQDACLHVSSSAIDTFINALGELSADGSLLRNIELKEGILTTVSCARLLNTCKNLEKLVAQINFLGNVRTAEHFLNQLDRSKKYKLKQFGLARPCKVMLRQIDADRFKRMFPELAVSIAPAEVLSIKTYSTK